MKRLTQTDISLFQPPSKKINTQIIDELMIDQEMIDNPFVYQPVVNLPLIDNPLKNELLIDKPFNNEPFNEQSFVNQALKSELSRDELLKNELFENKPFEDIQQYCRDHKVNIVQDASEEQQDSSVQENNITETESLIDKPFNNEPFNEQSFVNQALKSELFEDIQQDCRDHKVNTEQDAIGEQQDSPVQENNITETESLIHTSEPETPVYTSDDYVPETSAEEGSFSVSVGELEHELNEIEVDEENEADNKQIKKILQSIEYYQSKTNVLIPRCAFDILCKEILQEYDNVTQIEKDAVDALQTITEDYLIRVLSEAQNLVDFANRKCVSVKDIQMAIKYIKN